MMPVFEQGNSAAKNPGKKAVAQMVLEKLQKEKDSLSPGQFAELSKTYARLTAPRKRRRVKPKPKPKVEQQAEIQDSDWWRNPTTEMIDELKSRLERENREATPEESNCLYIWLRQQLQQARAEQKGLVPQKRSSAGCPETEQNGNDSIESTQDALL